MDRAFDPKTADGRDWPQVQEKLTGKNATHGITRYDGASNTSNNSSYYSRNDVNGRNEFITTLWKPDNYDSLPDEWKRLFDANPYIVEINNFHYNPWKPNASDKELQQLYAKAREYMADLLAKYNDHINGLPQTDLANKVAAGYNPAFLDSANAPAPASTGGVSDYAPSVNPNEQTEPLDIFAKAFQTATDVGNFALSVFSGINQYRSTQSALSLSASLERSQELENFIKGQNIWELFGSVTGGRYDSDLEAKFPLLKRYGFGEASTGSIAKSITDEADFTEANIRDWFMKAASRAYIPTLQDETGSYYVDNSFFEMYAGALRDLRSFSAENDILSTRFSSDYLKVARSLNLGQDTARYDNEFLSNLDPKILAEAKNAVADLQSKQTKWANDLHGKTWDHAIDLIENGNMAQKSWGLYLVEKLLGGQSPISDVGSGLSDLAKLLITKKVK